MPAQKRPHEPEETEEVDEEDDELLKPNEDEDEIRQESDESSDDSSSFREDNPEFISVELSAVRKEVQCPICLGIIKKTRTVMECLHRFCRVCIDKSMRLGNNECPACRTHCASRRSLRDDPRFDAIIAALYPDIDTYEEEESTFDDDEKTRNKQIQASIAQVIERQSEAAKKHTPTQRTLRNTRPRRRSFRGSEFQGSDDNGDEIDNDVNQDLTSQEKHSTEVKQRKNKKRVGAQSSQPSSSTAHASGEYMGNNLVANRESRGVSPATAWKPEKLAWGRGGTRSQTRHGSANGSSSKNGRSNHLSKLVNYFRSMDKNEDEQDVHLTLISLEKQSMPSLQQPYLCCQPSLTVNHLCEYVARQTSSQAEEVEILAVKGDHSINGNLPIDSLITSEEDSGPMPIVVDPCKDNLQVVNRQETLAAFKDSCMFSRNYMILAYRAKRDQLANS